ncbi:MAG: FHA domain-containing protein [bacterium]
MGDWNSLVNWWFSWGRILILLLDLLAIALVLFHGIWRGRRWQGWFFTALPLFLLFLVFSFTLRPRPYEFIIFLALFGGLATLLVALAYLIVELTSRPRAPASLREPAPRMLKPTAPSAEAPQTTVTGVCPPQEQPGGKPAAKMREAATTEETSTSSARDEALTEAALEIADKPQPVFIVKDIFCIGRQEGNDLVLDDTTVSRMHAIIRQQGGEYWIEDCGSTAGTIVNGFVVQEPLRLRDRDEILLGTTILRFSQTTENRRTKEK